VGTYGSAGYVLAESRASIRLLRFFRAVGGDQRQDLPAVRARDRGRVGEQRLAVERPHRVDVARGQHVHGEDVDAPEAEVLPGDDRAALAVGGDRGVHLAGLRRDDGAAELRPVGGGDARSGEAE